jgi:hypothetical protein
MSLYKYGTDGTGFNPFRHYDFPVLFQCRKMSDMFFFCCVCSPTSLLEPFQRFPSRRTDFSQQIAQAVLFLFLGRPCVLM